MQNSNDGLLEELKALLHRKKSNKYYAEKLGVTEAEVEQLKRELKEQKIEDIEVNESGTFIKNNIDKGTIEITSYYSHPPTPEEVIADHKIDTSIWKLSGYWSKQKGNGWQVSAFFTQKTITENLPEVINKVLNNYKSSYKPLKEADLLLNKRFESPSCAVISLCDFHLDKLVVEGTSPEEHVERYEKVLDNLAYRAYGAHYLEEIVFVIGNDFFHSAGGALGVTEKLTPQEISMSWDKAYEIGFDLMVKSITKLRQFCKNLKIILIPGNHAGRKEFYMAHALEVYFKYDENILFNRDSLDLKVHQYGETLLCFSHGNNINEKLPLVFATQFYKEWGQCRYKHLLLGDKHHVSEKMFKTQGEANGVRMTILPSLSQTDSWHRANLYVGAIQAGVCIVYDKQMGKCSEFECRI